MRVYVWLPGEDSHGKVMEVVDHTPAIMIYKPTLNARLDFENRYDVAFETEAIPIKKVPTKDGGVLNLAFRQSNGPAVAYGPTQLQAMAQWPELIPALCNTFECPDCATERYCFRIFIKDQVQCMECHATFSDYYLQAITKGEYQHHIKQTMDKIAGRIKASHFYREKAVAEFEGVEGLDESLWEGSGGLL